VTEVDLSTAVWIFVAPLVGTPDNRQFIDNDSFSIVKLNTYDDKKPDGGV
jgi:hypothetical protein